MCLFGGVYFFVGVFVCLNPCGVKIWGLGGYHLENSSVLAAFLLPMENFATFLDFSFLFFIFLYFSPQNLGRDILPTENFRGDIPPLSPPVHHTLNFVNTKPVCYGQLSMNGLCSSISSPHR